MLTKLRSFIVQHNFWEYSEFTGTPWGFPRKSIRRLSQENGISITSVLRILHDDLKLFPYFRGKLIKIKQNEKDFVKISVKDWKWPWLVGFERFERCWPLWPFSGICYTSCLPKFGHQTLDYPSIRYIVPAKKFPALPLCQKNWFCGKVRLDAIYRLLRSKLSSWIYIDVKKTSQVCCLNHLKNIEKNCKTQLWDEKQNRTVFLCHPLVVNMNGIL